jgi:hypothetical protein
MPSSAQLGKTLIRTGPLASLLFHPLYRVGAVQGSKASHVIFHTKGRYNLSACHNMYSDMYNSQNMHLYALLRLATPCEHTPKYLFFAEYYNKMEQCLFILKLTNTTVF